MTVRRLGAAFLALAICSVSGANASQLEQSRAEQKLGIGGLVGIWSCAGSYAGKPVRATMRWYHLEDGTLWNTLHPEHPSPADKAHATIAEQWQWDAESTGSRWLTVPDPSSSDRAAFSSTGAAGRRMTWIRQAAQSTMSRTFYRPSSNRLSFEEHYGGVGSPKVVVYSLACKRTLQGEPPPA
jgi:hypothetical protein